MVAIGGMTGTDGTIGVGEMIGTGGMIGVGGMTGTGETTDVGTITETETGATITFGGVAATGMYSRKQDCRKQLSRVRV